MAGLGGASTVEFYQIVLGAIASALAILSFGFTAGRRLQARRDREEIASLRTQRQALQSKVNGIVQSIAGKGQLWLRAPVVIPSRLTADLSRSVPIISIANLKGGVGKSTTAANLAAHLDKARGKRVLLIDLDYQGSLSSLCTAAIGQTNFSDLVSPVVGGAKDGEWVAQASVSLAPALPRTRICTSYYDFADFEEQQMVRWIAGDIATDIRFHLAEALQQPAIQKGFDIVICDCPPRLTTGCVNALAASTHLLVPTVLDRLSTEAVASFLRQVSNLRGQLFPVLQPLGVVGSMTRQAALGPTERRARDALLQSAPGAWRGPFPLFEQEFIPDRAAISAAAGTNIAYLVDAGARSLYARLGDAVCARLAPTWPHFQ